MSLAANNIVLSFFDGMLILYAVILSAAYLSLSAISIFGMRAYLRYSARFDYRGILSSPLAPGISLLAPAYNEGNTIIDNVKSLLSIMYNDLEVVIINDGSKDNTMEKLIDGFLLEKVPYHISYKIGTRKYWAFTNPRNRAFKKLTVVDKRNGGKADALNAGINISSKSLVACVDVDCILEREALLKMVRPFMEESVQVIASGGVIGIANSCVISEGRMLEVRLPETLVTRFQTLEYIRSFLLGRVAWSKLNGLLLISGAFGLFNKDIVINAGGYNINTVGEDMELVVRMRAYMHRKNRKYKVVYIPEPLCWTEAPSDYAILGRQRNRWTRGTFETLKLHRELFLNPRLWIDGLAKLSILGILRMVGTPGGIWRCDLHNLSGSSWGSELSVCIGVATLGLHIFRHDFNGGVVGRGTLL